MQLHLKTFAVAFLFSAVFFAGASFVFAAWQGTTWITNGAVVDATKIKDNFDYLYALWTLPDGNTIQTTRNVSAPAFLYSSDSSLKENIIPLLNSTAILSVQPKRFVWRETNQEDVGIIAQDVERVFPEFVHENNNGIKTVDYAKLMVPLLGVVREQQKEIEALKTRLDAAGI